jgi:PAS domain S-box-containing protein
LKNNSEVTTGSTVELDILFNLSHDIQCVINSSGFFEKINKNLIDHSGLTEPELLGSPLIDFIHVDDRDLVQQNILSLNDGAILAFEARWRYRNGPITSFQWKAFRLEESVYLTANASSLLNPNRRPSENTSNEALSGHNERRFQALVQNSSDLLAILSETGEYQYVSPTVKRILGFDAEHYIGKNAFSFIHPEDAVRLRPLFESIKNNFKVEIPPYRFISSDGKWHWLETVITNLLHDPAVEGIVANSRDITRQREMEDDVLRNSRRFNNLVEFNQEGSFTLNRDWRFTSLNSVVRNTPGLPPGVEIGGNIWKAIPNVINTTFQKEFTRAFEQNTAVHFKEFSPLFNKWFEVNAYPFEDSLTVMIRDITESKVHHLTLALEKEVLEMNAASGNSLKQVMDHLLTGFEKIHYGLKTSLGIIDKVNGNLTRISAPGMPELYELTNADVRSGKINSPCTQAAFQRSEVYVQDIFQEEIAADFRQILNNYNIRSSRSIPVINEKEEVLAVFTIFNNGHKHALMEETSLIQRLGTIIQLLIEDAQAKKDVERSHERFQLIMQATSDSIWDSDLRTQQVYRGRGFEKYYNQEPGLELSDLKKWEHNVHPEDSERVGESIETALNDPTTNKWTAEYRYLKKDGTYAPVIDKGLIMRDHNGKAIRILGALQDITELKKNQEKLVQSEVNYKNMFSNNPTPMWTYDMESQSFTMVNDAALALYGYSREEFLKLDLFAIRIKEDHQKVIEHLNSKAFLEDLSISHEWTHLKKDNTPMIVEVISHPLLINGRRSRLVAIKDITDKKKDRQEILAQNQRLREIAQISSHETRKPLASILGLVNLFDKENMSNPLNKEILQYLEITANELDTVIHNIVKKTWLESEASSAFRPE